MMFNANGDEPIGGNQVNLVVTEISKVETLNFLSTFDLCESEIAKEVVFCGSDVLRGQESPFVRPGFHEEFHSAASSTSPKTTVALSSLSTETSNDLEETIKGILDWWKIR